MPAQVGVLGSDTQALHDPLLHTDIPLRHGIATIMFVIPGLFLAAPFVVVPLLAMSYLLMLATSSYGFAASIRAAKRGFLPGSFAAIHIALHFFAVADFFSATVLYLQLRRADKARIASAEASASAPPQHSTDVQCPHD